MTRLAEQVQDALRNIWRHKLRSFLALLGIMFGIASVITILGIGRGAQESVLREISVMGLQNIIADTKRPQQVPDREQRGYERFNYGITYRDVDRLRANLPGATIITARTIQQKIAQGSRLLDGKILGIPEQYLALFNARRLEGQLFGALHNESNHHVALMNADLAAASGSLGSPVNSRVKIGGKYFTVIGVVDIPIHKGAPHLYIPKRTADMVYREVTFRRLAGQTEWSRVEVGQLVVHVPDEKLVKPASRLVRTLLSQHPLDDWQMSVPLQLLESKQKAQQIINLVLTIIAAISLLVGGIGIMNIMLANVSERLNEIGIRRAVGATRADITLQFLTESATLTLLGGILGCLLGVVAVPVAARLIGWEAIVTWTAILTALLVSLAVGILFGIFPAFHASKHDPGNVLQQY